jgi:hypothetical protein
MENNQNSDEVLLEDLLSGNDRLLTSGEVAEILNVNANTLYLWRTSPEVNLPFQRFVAPGQSRGMIRYRYTDVVKFIGEARERAATEQESTPPSGTQRRTVVVELSDEEELTEANKTIAASEAKARVVKRAKNKAKKKALQNVPLEDLIKFKPEFVPEPVVVNEDVKAKAEEVLREMMKSFNKNNEEEL